MQTRSIPQALEDSGTGTKELIAPGAVFIIMHESVWESWANDFGTIAAIVLAAGLNVAYLDNNGFVNAMLSFMFIMGVISWGSKTKVYKMTRRQLKAFAQEL